MNKYQEWYDKLVFLDLETSGLDAVNDKIIQIGIVILDSKFNFIEDFDAFIYHEGLILSEKIVELTNISDDDLKTGIDESELVDKLKNLFTTNTLVLAYNAQFDLSFIYNLFRRYNLQFDFNKPDFLDVMTVYKDIASYPHKLLNAIEHFNLGDKVKNTHRATDDTFAMVEVFKEMIKTGVNTISYINRFGYNPKYGVSYHKLNKVEYFPQYYKKF